MCTLSSMQICATFSSEYLFCQFQMYASNLFYMIYMIVKTPEVTSHQVHALNPNIIDYQEASDQNQVSQMVVPRQHKPRLS